MPDGQSVCGHAYSQALIPGWPGRDGQKETDRKRWSINLESICEIGYGLKEGKNLGNKVNGRALQNGVAQAGETVLFLKQLLLLQSI